MNAFRKHCGKLAWKRNPTVRAYPNNLVVMRPSEKFEAKPSRTSRIDAKIYLATKLSQEQQQGILEAADSCHITKSIQERMQIVCSLTEPDNR